MTRQKINPDNYNESYLSSYSNIFSCVTVTEQLKHTLLSSLPSQNCENSSPREVHYLRNELLNICTEGQKLCAHSPLLVGSIQRMISEMSPESIVRAFHNNEIYSQYWEGILTNWEQLDELDQSRCRDFLSSGEDQLLLFMTIINYPQTLEEKTLENICSTVLTDGDEENPFHFSEWITFFHTLNEKYLSNSALSPADKKFLEICFYYLQAYTDITEHISTHDATSQGITVESTKLTFVLIVCLAWARILIGHENISSPVLTSLATTLHSFIYQFVEIEGVTPLPGFSIESFFHHYIHPSSSLLHQEILQICRELYHDGSHDVAFLSRLTLYEEENLIKIHCTSTFPLPFSGAHGSVSSLKA